MGGDPVEQHVQPPLRPITPALHPGVLALVHFVLPVLLRFRFFPWLPAGIAAVEVSGAERLAHSFHRFESGEIRLLLAVRHCEVDDPLCGLHLLSRVLPRAAERIGLRVPHPAHAHFLFDRGMTLWGGPVLGWFLSRLGGVSIRRGRHPDRQAMRQARELVLNGRFPFAVAPEGATNGHGECLGPLQPGIAQLGLWCVEDLRRSNRSAQVVILPIGLRYEYCRPQWWRLESLMARLESQIGLSPPPPAAEGAEETRRQYLHRRLSSLGSALLGKLERYYPATPSVVAGATLHHHAQDPRWSFPTLVERALRKAEDSLGLHPVGTTVDRCRRLEEKVWKAVHPDDLPPRRRLSRLERGLADRAALEASLAEVHMRLAECFVAVSGSYVAERPSFERFMETTLLMHDAVSRLRGGGLPCRPRIGARRALISVGTPLSVTDRCSRSPGERPTDIERGRARELIRGIGEDLRLQFEAMIHASVRGGRPPLPSVRCPG